MNQLRVICDRSERFLRQRMSLRVEAYPTSDADRIEIKRAFARVHGAPVHIGKPELIGIADLAAPDYGDPVPVGDDELPVFWACGVTPQAAIAAARPDLCITHYPGAMPVTDRRIGELGG
jgi:uncharacterized protein YcsI (UPF0317 family)